MRYLIDSLADVDRVYPGLFWVICGTVSGLTVLVLFLLYLWATLRFRDSAEMTHKEGLIHHRLQEEFDRDFKRKSREMLAELDEARAANEEKKREIIREAEELKIRESLVKAAAVEVQSKQSEISEAFSAAKAVTEAVERAEDVYNQLAGLLEKALEDPAKLAAHIDPARLDKQVKKISAALDACLAYWDKMDILRFGPVAKEEKDAMAQGRIK